MSTMAAEGVAPTPANLTQRIFASARRMTQKAGSFMKRAGSWIATQAKRFGRFVVRVAKNVATLKPVRWAWAKAQTAATWAWSTAAPVRVGVRAVLSSPITWGAALVAWLVSSPVALGVVATVFVGTAIVIAVKSGDKKPATAPATEPATEPTAPAAEKLTPEEEAYQQEAVAEHPLVEVLPASAAVNGSLRIQDKGFVPQETVTDRIKVLDEIRGVAEDTDDWALLSEVSGRVRLLWVRDSPEGKFKVKPDATANVIYREHRKTVEAEVAALGEIEDPARRPQWDFDLMHKAVTAENARLKKVRSLKAEHDKIAV